jgi:uncharacterized protein YbaR (Trm112 family)
MRTKKEDRLACPQCKGGLRMEEKEAFCAACKSVYPVRDGILILLVEEGRRWE